MRVTFLGTGSAMPAGDRVQTGLLLESNDDTLLVDCGSGVLHGLARTSVGYEGVDTVLLSHHHLDHVSDLMVFLKARWLAGETAMTVVGPPGTGNLVDDLLDVHDCSFPDDVDVSNHPTPESLGRALGERDADLGLVSLSHLYPHTEGRHEEMLDSIADRYDGDVRVAEDGVTIEFD